MQKCFLLRRALLRADFQARANNYTSCVIQSNCRRWLKALLGTMLPPGEGLAELLRSGRLLCAPAPPLLDSCAMSFDGSHSLLAWSAKYFSKVPLFVLNIILRCA